MTAATLRFALVIGAVPLVLASCANLSVTQVSDKNSDTVKGQRYYLPKPIIIVAPQADGTVAVSVDYLPDRSHEYAIDTDTQLSAYTYQAATDIRGLLIQVEFKADTTAVGQQLAASAGASAAQLANYQSAQILAHQTAVTAAQAAVDTAKVTSAAAREALAIDQARAQADPTSVTPIQLAADVSASAQADARLAVAQQILTRAQATSVAVAINAAAGSAASTTGPTMGTMITQPAWTAPAAISVPDKFPPVVFVVNDTYRYNADGTATGGVSLLSVQSEMKGAAVLPEEDLEAGVKPKAEPTFATTSTALGRPTLLPLDQTVPLSKGIAMFAFDRPIKGITSPSVVTDNAAQTVQSANVKLSDDGKYVTFDISQFKPGDYKLSLTMGYATDSTGAIMKGKSAVKFTVK